MNRYLILPIILIITLICNSCKKTDIFENDKAKLVIGSWQWVSTNCGWSGESTPHSTQTEVQINFSTDGKYQKIVNGKKEMGGYYFITERLFENKRNELFLRVSKKSRNIDKNLLFETWINVDSPDSMYHFTGGDDGCSTLFIRK